MRKKRYFVLDVISFIIITFNAISVVSFWLPPGRAYYMPELLMEISMILSAYSVFGLGISGVVGCILNLISIIYKKRKSINVTNNIIYIILFVLTIPLAYFLYNVALSV